ncbi:MAG TPA: hypothetical protein VG454_16330 [Gemmatimonadales bacterium]|nr:hypothetical protein [Gemmatimonadales bacterium]
MLRWLALTPALLCALPLAACHNDSAAPSPSSADSVLVATDASEYPVTSPPHEAFVTVTNHTQDAITVRRCLDGSSPDYPVGLDLVVEEETGSAWQPVDFGFDCTTAGAPRADAILAPKEVALVLRLVATRAGRFRVRIAYGVGVNAMPADTATSPTFVYR